MRNGWKLLLLVLLAVSLTMLVACEAEEEPEAVDPDEEEVDEVEPFDYVWTSGPTGGMTYPAAAGWTELIEEKVSGSRITIVEGAAIANIEKIEADEAQLGHTMGDLMAAAERNMEPFEDGRPNVKTLANVMPFEFQFVVLEGTGLTSFEQLKEEQYPLRLNPGEEGYSGELATRRVLEAHGITYEDIEEWGGEIVFVPYSEGVTLMRDGHIDAFSALSSSPTPTITEIAITRDLNLLPLSEEVQVGLFEEYGYAYGDIPAESYEFLDEDVPGIISPMVLIARSDVPNEQVKFMLDLIYSEEGVSRLASVHERFTDLNIEDGQEFLFQIHPGAVEFYEEN